MMRMMILFIFVFTDVFGARIKDVARIEGLSDYQLVGYGLVVGLDGTGDGARTLFTSQSVMNMLRNLGIEVQGDNTRLRNVAAVMITSNMRPYLKPGAQMDIQLSSLGDARSLEGGTLIMAPLMGPDGEIYAIAQGPVSVGGVSASGSSSKVSRNHALTASIPGGAIIQKERVMENLPGTNLRWSLNEPDFSSAAALAEALNRRYPKTAVIKDAATVNINVPANFSENVMAYIAEMENLEFDVSVAAKVILNEKTGTIVAGSNVKISQVAVSHGSITINVDSKENVSQPNPFSQGNTMVTREEKVNLNEEPADVKVLPAVSNVGELAKALNSLGVKPRDIISIFQAIKRAGALHAELVIM